RTAGRPADLRLAHPAYRALPGAAAPGLRALGRGSPDPCTPGRRTAAMVCVAVVLGIGRLAALAVHVGADQRPRTGRLPRLLSAAADPGTHRAAGLRRGDQPPATPGLRAGSRRCRQRTAAGLFAVLASAGGRPRL